MNLCLPNWIRRRQAGQVGMDKAEVWIGLTDGGNGLEEFVRRDFPRDPVLILDFWHASEHLTELGQLLYPADAERRQYDLPSACVIQKRGRAMASLLAPFTPAKSGRLTIGSTNRRDAYTTANPETGQVE